MTDHDDLRAKALAAHSGECPGDWFWDAWCSKHDGATTATWPPTLPPPAPDVVLGLLDEVRCQAMTEFGGRCGRTAENCSQHSNRAELAEANAENTRLREALLEQWEYHEDVPDYHEGIEYKKPHWYRLPRTVWEDPNAALGEGSE